MFGNTGQSDYAMANAWLGAVARKLAADLPDGDYHVRARGIEPTYGYISEVMRSLSRRWGHVRSRMPPGQRSWREVDVF